LHDGPVARSAWQRLFAVSACSYLLLTGVVLAASIASNHGVFVYSLDDPYIHLSMARNWLRVHGVGITPDSFAPASSSPLWTALIVACSAVFGLHDSLPLWLNLLSGLATLAVFWWARARLRQRAAAVSGDDDGPRWTWMALALPILLNLPGLTLCGMEHVLHAALVLAFVGAVFCDASLGGCCVLAALLPLVRLESVFVTGAAAFVLARRRQLPRAALLLACSALPIVLLGAWMRARGAFFLPNSIVAKAVPPLLSAWLEKWRMSAAGLAVNPLLLLVLLFALRYRRGQARLIADGFTFAFLLALQHVLLSTVGGIGLIDRYESYVIDAALLFMLASPAPAIHERGPRCVERVLIVCGGLEKVCVLLTALLATTEIYAQQYQMGRFIAEQLPRAGVAVNDIGVVSLRARGPVVDLAGLGSTDVLRALRATGRDTRALDRRAIDPILAAHGVDVIMIYPHWFSERLYGGWRRVASWTLPRPAIVVGGSSVVFFARDREHARRLAQHLHAFERELPPGVRAAYARLAP
jgi:hypothetical protein